MWVKNWFGSYEQWRLRTPERWGDHSFKWYAEDVNELLRTTMLEF